MQNDEHTDSVEKDEQVCNFLLVSFICVAFLATESLHSLRPIRRGSQQLGIGKDFCWSAYRASTISGACSTHGALGHVKWGVQQVQSREKEKIENRLYH